MQGLLCYDSGSDRSRLGQAETEVQARARARVATAGHQYRRLSRAKRNSGNGRDGGGRGWETQGFAGRGRM